jgi:hypothetical protein
MKRTLSWATGLALFLASVAGLLAPASAQESAPPSGVGGYTLNASAAATRQIFKPENNIIPSETLIDLSIPYSLGYMAQGSGRAVGSTVWPGDTLATACRAEPSIPCYPFYAESNFPQGPADGKAAQEVPGSTMTAHSEEQESVGKAEFSPQGAGGSGVGVMTSSSTASIKTGTAVAESVSRVSDIILGGGTIRIESVVSHAKAVSDGNAADAQGSTAVTGFTIAGFPVAVTTEGVSIAGQFDVPNPLGPALDPVNATLETLGMQVRLSKPVVTKEGGKAEVVAGGLIISVDNAIVLDNVPGEIKGQLPADPTGRTTLVFGQASALSDASPGFADDLPVEDTTEPIADFVEDIPADLSAGDTVAVTSEPAPFTETAAPSGGGAVVQAANRRMVDGKAVGMGLVLMAMVGAVAVAAGLHRLGTGLFEPTAVTACPQEKP